MASGLGGGGVEGFRVSGLQQLGLAACAETIVPLWGRLLTYFSIFGL